MELPELLAHGLSIPPGWQDDWLSRTSVPLQLAVVILGPVPNILHSAGQIFGWRRILGPYQRRSHGRSSALEDLERLIEDLRTAERADSYLGKVWIATIAVFSTVDLAICLGALCDSLKQTPQQWTLTAVYDLLIYLVYYAALLSAAFSIMPLFESIAIAGLVAERKSDDDAAVSQPAQPFGMWEFDLLAKICYMTSVLSYNQTPLNAPPSWHWYVRAVTLGSAVSSRSMIWAWRHRQPRFKALRLEHRTFTGWLNLYCKGILAVCGPALEGYLEVPLEKLRARIDADRISSGTVDEKREPSERRVVSSDDKKGSPVSANESI